MLRCMIVDDEPPARELIASYVERLDDAELVACCENALEAFSCLQKQEVDLIFLDINMPKLTGLDLIRSLHNPPEVVFITAHKEYAVDGFDLDVLDYLVKPVSFQRFMRSISRYHQRNTQLPGPEQATDPFRDAYLFIRVNRMQVKVFLRDILYVESLKDYIRVVTGRETHITYSRLSYMDEVLPENHFVRIHKSYIVSLSAVSSYGSDSLRIGDTELPVGRIYKQGFSEAMGRFRKDTGG